jgi:hypothetical protein
MTAPTPRPNATPTLRTTAASRHQRASQFAQIMVVVSSIWFAVMVVVGLFVSFRTKEIDQYGYPVDSAGGWQGILTILSAAVVWLFVMMLARHVQAVALDHEIRNADPN